MSDQIDKLKERIFLFLYVHAQSNRKININTFKRYIYLYYLSYNFFYHDADNLLISFDKTDITIPKFDDILDEFYLLDYIILEKNCLIINDKLIDKGELLLSHNDQNQKGQFNDLYKEIKPFVNLLESYDDELIFTIFFSEPTFQEANQRGLDSFNTSNSILSTLLTQFKNNIEKKNIDDYDILTHWMDFILRNYYKEVLTYEE